MFPYHLGYRRNFTQVINWSGRCRGNGLEWEVVEGCFEFSLTAEQLEQKKLKRKQAVSHFIYFYRHLVPCPEIEGHWSLSEHLGQMATQVWICSDNIYYMMYIGGHSLDWAIVRTNLNPYFDLCMSYMYNVHCYVQLYI